MQSSERKLFENVSIIICACNYIVIVIISIRNVLWRRKNDKTYFTVENSLSSVEIGDHNLNFLTSHVRFVPPSQLSLLANLQMSDAHSALSSEALLGTCTLMTTASTHFLPLLFSQHNCLLQRTLPSQNIPEVGQCLYCHLCLHQCFKLSLL